MAYRAPEPIRKTVYDYIIPPREAYERLRHGLWSALDAEARSAGWERKASDGWTVAPKDFATVYEGKPGVIYLHSQGWS